MIPPYFNLHDKDGNPVTIFLQGIVMIAPGTHGGAYIQLMLGGISTQETYEIVKGRLQRLEELAGGGEVQNTTPSNPDPFLRGPL